MIVIKVKKLNKQSATYKQADGLYTEGLNLLVINKNAEGLKKITAAANLEHIDALFFLAEHEWYVESNYDHAITLYQNAAKYGDINSLRRLTVIYRQNDAVPQNISMVNSYLETRAKLGDPEGCNELAMTYILGIGKNIDYSKGIKHLEKAASLNCINAQFNLAKAYAIGKIVPKDSHKSFNYHKLAAETKHPEGIYRLGCLYLTGYSHIKRNVRKAIKLLNDAAKCGHILSCYKLAHIYRCKKYGEQNVKLAKLWTGLGKKYEKIFYDDETTTNPKEVLLD